MILSDKVWPRVVAHADMDAFYAAVEQLDDPALRGRPLLVGSASGRGVVLTASYEARPYGVGSAMPMAKARRLCPSAVIVPPRFDRYQDVSRTIMDVFYDFSPEVEALSLDEAFLDMTGSERLFGTPESIGRRLKTAVREATGGLTASVGLSATKYVAKVASGYRKPDGLTVVAAGRGKGLAGSSSGISAVGCWPEKPSSSSQHRSPHHRGRSRRGSCLPFSAARKVRDPLPCPRAGNGPQTNNWQSGIQKHWIRKHAR